MSRKVYKKITAMAAMVLAMIMALLLIAPLKVSAYDESFDKCFKLSSMTEEEIDDLVGQYMTTISFRRQEIFLDNRETGIRTKILYTNSDIKDMPVKKTKKIITFYGTEYTAVISIEKKTDKPFLTLVHSPSGYEEKYFLSNQEYELPDLTSGDWELNNVCVPLPEFTFINEKAWSEVTVFVQRENSVRYARGEVNEIYCGTTEGGTVHIYVDKNGNYFYELEDPNE